MGRVCSTLDYSSATRRRIPIPFGRTYIQCKLMRGKIIAKISGEQGEMQIAAYTDVAKQLKNCRKC